VNVIRGLIRVIDDQVIHSSGSEDDVSVLGHHYGGALQGWARR
jgi:hypothetical protein